MKFLQTIGAFLNAWTASVAAAIIAGFERLVSPRVVRLIEDANGEFEPTVSSSGNGLTVHPQTQSKGNTQ